MKGKLVLDKARNFYRTACQKISAATVAPSEAQGRTALFVFGVGLLAVGLSSVALAASDGTNGLTATYNDTRVSNSVNMILTYLEGSFGALVMVAAGIGAILSAAFGQYRAALGCLVVAVGAFILRSFLSTFFNDATIKK